MPEIKNYFIVDDDRDDQIFLIEALTENCNNIRCYTAFNGQEALTDLSTPAFPIPDAIFLDLNMPRLNGKQCLAELKLTPGLMEIPVIMYSTSSAQQEISDALQMGAYYFLVKKGSYKELRDELILIMALLAKTHAQIAEA